MGITRKHAIFSLMMALPVLLFLYANAGMAQTWQKAVDFGTNDAVAIYEETGNAWRTYDSPLSHNYSYRYLSHYSYTRDRVGTARWTIKSIPYDGIYEVAISWRATENRTPDANYFVLDSNGELEAHTYSQIGDGSWRKVILGNYFYKKGQRVWVLLDGTDDEYSDCADAAFWKLVKIVHTVTATAKQNGAIQPSGAVYVREGESRKFTFTPDEGFRVLDVLVDGESVGAVGSYTLRNVSGNHTITALFTSKAVPGTNLLLLKNP